MKVRLTRSAQSDLISALTFYAEQSRAAANKFIEHFTGVKEQLEDWPRSGQIVDINVRRVLIPGFPYGVFYRISDEVVIIAVLDLRRNPDSLNNRIL